MGATLVAATTVAGVVFAGQLVTQGKTAKAATDDMPKAPDAAPDAQTVAVQLAVAANARSRMTAGGGRIDHVSCIQGGPDSYACSYVRTVPSRGNSCAVAILRWTPNPSSTYTVQKAGRVRLAPEACGPVTRVLHVLGTSG